MLDLLLTLDSIRIHCFIRG